MAGLILAGTFVYFGLRKQGHASSDSVHPPKMPWAHRRFYQTYDHASIRRGFQVYRAVCASCHSMNSIAYRHLIDVCLTTDEAKIISAQAEIADGPNDEGEMFKRPGKIIDHLPPPYENDEMARYINNGALPPDLSLIIKARHYGEDYIYALLTGYRDPPAGVNVKDGLYYNPYMAGGTIAMAQALTNNLVEYEDGTPATISQMAKDVSTFLKWGSSPELEDRKRFGIKTLLLLSVCFVASVYWKRIAFAPLKSRIIRFF